jgi:hypothetical protein
MKFLKKILAEIRADRAQSRWIMREVAEMLAHEKAMNTLDKQLRREYRTHNGNSSSYRK